MQNAKNSEGSYSSERKIATNRANAKKSTGPRTAEGKINSSMNAIKFGFFSKAVVLPGEDSKAYESLREEIWSSLCPQDGLEAVYVREIIDTHWRLQRLACVEAAVFTRRALSFTGHDCGPGFAFINDDQGHATFSHLAAYEAALSRRLHRALEQFRKVREKRGEDGANCTGGIGPMTNGAEPIVDASVETPATLPEALSNQQAASTGPQQNHHAA